MYFTQGNKQTILYKYYIHVLNTKTFIKLNTTTDIDYVQQQSFTLKTETEPTLVFKDHKLVHTDQHIVQLLDGVCDTHRWLVQAAERLQQTCGGEVALSVALPQGESLPLKSRICCSLVSAELIGLVVEASVPP